MLLMGHLTKVANEVSAAFQNAPITDNDPNQAPYPKIVVDARWAIVGTEPHDALSVSVQNHSSITFFMRSLTLELENERSLFLMKGAMGLPIEHTQVLEPGRGATFVLDFDVIRQLEEEAGSNVRRLVVTDQIDRKFYSTEDSLKVAFSNHEGRQKNNT